MDNEHILGHHRVDDVNWLCCLTESELDLLMELKMMVIHRARLIDCDSMVEKFDLKILRALGFILMEHCKQNIKNMPDSPVSADICASLDRCNLLKQDNKDGSGSISIEELIAFIGKKKRKAAESYNEEVFQDPRGELMEED